MFALYLNMEFSDNKFFLSFYNHSLGILLFRCDISVKRYLTVDFFKYIFIILMNYFFSVLKHVMDSGIIQCNPIWHKTLYYGFVLIVWGICLHISWWNALWVDFCTIIIVLKEFSLTNMVEKQPILFYSLEECNCNQNKALVKLKLKHNYNLPVTNS